MANTERAVFRVHIAGTREAIWKELTKTNEPQQAMFNTTLHTDGLKPGGQIRMRTGNTKYTGVVGEVLEFDPPHRYAHTFRFTQYDDPPCTVIYELKDVDGGVELTLTCENIPSGTKTAKQMKQGGGFITKTLKSIVETGKSPFSSRMLFVVFKLTEPLSPKSTLSENWPLDKKV